MGTENGVFAWLANHLVLLETFGKTIENRIDARPIMATRFASLVAHPT
jgi:hypothetical protein